MEWRAQYNFDQVGEKDMYLLHHEEIESLAKNIPGIKRIRFFMTFGQSYLTHMKCLEDVGMLRTDPIMVDGKEIVPIQVLKELLPDPASLGPRTVGKTNIGCIFTGVKDGKKKSIYIYNVCDHQECYKEVESQAISYTQCAGNDWCHDGSKGTLEEAGECSISRRWIRIHTWRLLISSDCLGR